MTTPLSRRAFAKLASLLLADGVPCDLGALMRFLEADQQPGAQSPAPTTPAGSTLSETATKVLDSISNYASQATSALNDASHKLAQASFTVGVYNFAQGQAANVGVEVESGTAVSYTPSNTDYASENFRTEIQAANTAAGLGAQAGSGISIGIGDLSGFNGQSNNVSVSAGPLTVAFSSNETYAGVSISVGLGGGAAASYAGSSNTTPTTDITSGNAAGDLESFQNALMQSSSDSLMDY